VGCLPLVDGAVSAGKSVRLGIFKSVQDGLVLGVEGDAKREGDKIEKRISEKIGTFAIFTNIFTLTNIFSTFLSLFFV